MGLKRCSSSTIFLLYRKGTEQKLRKRQLRYSSFRNDFLFQTPIPISPAKVETHEERCRPGCGI